MDRPYRIPLLLFAVPLVAACQSGGSREPVCKLQAGMTTNQLVSCGCQMTNSGGAGVVGDAYGGAGRSVTVAEFVCPQGDAGLGGVAVVDGVVQKVLY